MTSRSTRKQNADVIDARNTNDVNCCVSINLATAAFCSSPRGHAARQSKMLSSRPRGCISSSNSSNNRRAGGHASMMLETQLNPNHMCFCRWTADQSVRFCASPELVDIGCTEWGYGKRCARPPLQLIRKPGGTKPPIAHAVSRMSIGRKQVG